MKMPPKMGARPSMEDDEEDDDMAAIGSLMASEESPAMEVAEHQNTSGDPATIVADLKAKLAELEASLSQL